MKFGVKDPADMPHANAVDMSTIEGRVVESYSQAIKKRRDPDHNALYWLFSKFRRREDIRIIESPKPMSIRRKRRLRGKAKGIAKQLRAQRANFDWQF